MWFVSVARNYFILCYCIFKFILEFGNGDVQVKRSLFSSEGRVLEKNDNTPVTVANFGVQALVSSGNF